MTTPIYFTKFLSFDDAVNNAKSGCVRVTTIDGETHVSSPIPAGSLEQAGEELVVALEARMPVSIWVHDSNSGMIKTIPHDRIAHASLIINK